jgi:prolyl-tRNA synthetase
MPMNGSTMFLKISLAVRRCFRRSADEAGYGSRDDSDLGEPANDGQLKDAGVRAHLDDRAEKMNAKIREHTMQKIPFLLVVGDKEAESGTVNVRVRGQQQPEGTVLAEQFVERVKKLIAEKSAGLTTDSH